MNDGVFGRNFFVPAPDQLIVHGVNAIKWTAAMPDDIVVEKVLIAGKKVFF